MTVQNEVKQRIGFISANNNFDDIMNIFNNSLIQSFMNNSTGKKCPYGFQNDADFNTGVVVFSTFFFIDGYITVAFQATVQANVPNLQAAFPQYTVFTEGGNVSFGN